MTRRPAIPTRVKLDILIRQEGRCACGCRERLGSMDNVEWDHVPALVFRSYNAKTGLYDPPANDPTRIFAKIKAHHDEKTVRDIKSNAKTKRVKAKHEGTFKRKSPKMPGQRFSGWKTFKGEPVRAKR